MFLTVITSLAAECSHQALSVILHLKLLKLIVLLLDTAAVIHVHFGLSQLVDVLPTEFVNVKELLSLLEYVHYFRSGLLLLGVLALAVAS